MRTCAPGARAVGTTPGFRRSSESTVVPNLAAIAPSVSPFWITYQRLGGAGFARVAVDDASARLTAGGAFVGTASERTLTANGEQDDRDHEQEGGRRGVTHEHMPTVGTAREALPARPGAGVLYQPETVHTS